MGGPGASLLPRPLGWFAFLPRTQHFFSFKRPSEQVRGVRVRRARGGRRCGARRGAAAVARQGGAAAAARMRCRRIDKGSGLGHADSRLRRGGRALGRRRALGWAGAWRRAAGAGAAARTRAVAAGSAHAGCEPFSIAAHSAMGALSAGTPARR
jgi:hypothetical protein